MNTLLINPDHGNAVNNYPWGVLSVGSYLKQRGQNVRLLDLSNFPGKIDDKIEEAIEWAHLVGNSCGLTRASMRGRYGGVLPLA